MTRRTFRRTVFGLALTIACCALLCLPPAAPLKAQTDSLVLTYPVGGEIFYTNRDTVITIRWSGVSDTMKVKLEWSTDGLRWNVIADSVNSLQYPWNVVGLPLSSAYRLRVRQVRGPFTSDNVKYTGHTAPVTDGAWSPAGDRVVTVSRAPHIWDAEVGGSIPLVSLPSNNVNHSSVVWSADSLRIVAGADDVTARVFDTRTNQVEVSLPHPASVLEVAIDPSSTRVFTSASDDRLRWFQLPNSSSSGTFIPASPLLDMAMSHDGDRVLACADRGARVYSIAGGLPVQFNKHQAGTLAGAWSPNDSLICTIGGDRTIRLWDPFTGTELWSAIDDIEGVRCVSFSPDGKLIAVGMTDSTVTIWDVATGTIHATAGGHRAQIRVVAWAPQGDLLASASDDNSIRIFDVEKQQTLNSFLHTGDVVSAHWGPDGNRLLTTSVDQTAVIWRVREITLQGDTSAVFSISAPPPAFARFTANGDTLNIGEETTITVGMEGAYNIDLADIDSVQFSLSYDATMLHRLDASQPVRSVTDSGSHLVVTYAPVALPTIDGPLMTVRFRATLGADSITALHFSKVLQIGTGVPIPIETHSDSILVRGICRAGGVGRLFQPVGSVLNVQGVEISDGMGVIVTLAELGETTITAYDILGSVIWSDRASIAEQQDRYLERRIPSSIIGTFALLVVTSPTQVATLAVTGAR